MSDTAVAEMPVESAPPPRRHKPTPSEKLLTDINTVGLVPSEAEVAEIAAISNSDMAKMFVELRLDTCFDPDELQKRGVFLSELFKRIHLKPILAAVHLYTIGGAQRIIEFTRNLQDGKDQEGLPLANTLSNEELIASLKLESLTQTELSKMVVRALKAEPQVSAAPAPERPPNKAPDSLAQPPTLVQITGGVTHVHGQADGKTN